MLYFIFEGILIACVIFVLFRLNIIEAINSFIGGKDYLFTRKKIDTSNINVDEIIFNIKKNENFFQEFQFLTWSRYVIMNFFNRNKDSSDKELQEIVSEYALKKRDRYLKSKDDLFVKDASYYSYSQSDGEILILFRMRKKEYVLTENEVTNYKDYYYIASFEKKNDAEKMEKMYKCSLCGAPVKFSFFGRCRYCGKYIYVSDVMWRMKDIIKCLEDK